MRITTTTTAITSAALLLTLTACGSGDDGETTASDDSERIEALEAELEEAQAESGDEGGEGMESEPVDEPVDNEGLAPKDMDFSDDPILADREFTGRMTGDVVAGLGEPVEIDQGAFEGIGDYMGTLTLDEIYAAPECETTTGEVIQPEGELLVATFTIGADENAKSEFSVSHGDFRWLGHDAEIAYYEMFNCTDAVNPTSASVRPGETAQRTFVFDIPEFEGALGYTAATNYVDFEIDRSDYDNAERLPETAGDEAATKDTASANSPDSTAVTDTDPNTPYSAQFPSADEVDFYGPMSHPDELLVDINTIPDCEIAHIIWGGLQNGEMEGFDIDYQYLGLLENWMQGVGCL